MATGIISSVNTEEFINIKAAVAMLTHSYRGWSVKIYKQKHTQHQGEQAEQGLLVCGCNYERSTTEYMIKELQCVWCEEGAPVPGSEEDSRLTLEPQ